MATGSMVFRAGVRGLTLVELMVVVAIVAIFAGLAGPSFSAFIAEQRVRNAASAVSEAVWLARSEAMKRNQEVTFSFATSGWRMSTSALASSCASNPADCVAIQEGFNQVTATLKSGSTGVFTANAYGRLAAPQIIELTVAGISSATRCVSVSQSGKASIKDGACT